MDSSLLPSFAEFANRLHSIDPESHISQVHGLICGLICKGEQTSDHLVAQVFPRQENNAECAALLQELYTYSDEQLLAFSFEFSLLLPEDDSDINVRAEALGLWCQGFLTGFKDHAKKINDPEVAEVLKDFNEMTKINFGDIDTTEEDELSYTELVEYVRLSVLMIFQNLNKTAPSDNTSLH